MMCIYRSGTFLHINIINLTSFKEPPPPPQSSSPSIAHRPLPPSRRQRRISDVRDEVCDWLDVLM
ncbi:hypothetical protein HanPSC8_Chr16g0725491 [Helianthus annuus]|nr:hypothetical protein HanPSC8_Chr16g0725491 [Helianthus annuus]